MSERATRRMSADDFYAWVSERSEGRFELVDGEPVMMAGAGRRHDIVVANAQRLIGNHLLGHPCRPFTADTYIRIPAGNRRQADAGIDCGSPADESLEAAEPVLVVEVLSPTTRIFDCTDKLEEYKTVRWLTYILLVDTQYPQVRLYTRDAGGVWTSERIMGLESRVVIPKFNMELPLADLYNRLEFRPRPTLVEPETPDPRFSI